MAKAKRAAKAKGARPRKEAGQASELAEFLMNERMEEVQTLDEMASMMGISKSHLNDIVKGRKIVSLPRAIRFAELLSLPVAKVVRLVLQDQLTRAGLDLTVVVS